MHRCQCHTGISSQGEQVSRSIPGLFMKNSIEHCGVARIGTVS